MKISERNIRNEKEMEYGRQQQYNRQKEGNKKYPIDCPIDTAVARHKSHKSASKLKPTLTNPRVSETMGKTMGHK
jgi:hypothetical protein